MHGPNVPQRIRRVQCRVLDVRDATHDIRVVRLAVEGGAPFPFAPGQYASVTFDALPPRDYSMANVPADPVLEFHVRHTGSDGASAYVARKLRAGERVTVEGPFGKAWLRPDHPGPILAVAGGSGLAPMKSIVEAALAAGVGGEIHLFFGARDERDVYLESHFRALAERHHNLRFHVVLSHPSAKTARSTGFVSDAVARAFDDVRGFKAYLAGPPAMVEATYDLLLARDLGRDDIHADPFYTEAEKATGLARL